MARRKFHNLLYIVVVAWIFQQTKAFNLSPIPNAILREPSGNPELSKLKTRSSYFGYSMVLRRNSIIVGAPRAQTDVGVNETGAIYQCPLSLDTAAPSCAPFRLDAPQRPPDDAFQWLGAAMDGGPGDEDRLLVCAPRFAGERDSSGRNEYLQGVCYWTLGGSDVRILRPLADRRRQVKDQGGGRLSFHFRLGEAGFSAHVTPDQKECLMGAPGINDWQGSAIRYDTGTQRFSIPSSSPASEHYGYAGYAVASGHLDDANREQLLYVVTVPHPGGHTELGKAYIFDYGDKDSLEKYLELEGTQYGEFFGYAVLAEDVNGDGLDDVLVSAPLHSAQGLPDAGALHVFLNRGAFKFQRQLIESPCGQAGARFGTTVSDLGDVNRDGFNDVAVGAPFAGSGIVAIYLGGAHGLGPQPSQILNLSLSESGGDEQGQQQQQSMFGHGLSKGVDVDGNGFNDLAIGAPDAELVLLYRAYPVVQVVASIRSRQRTLAPADDRLEVEVCWQLATNSTLVHEQELDMWLVADAIVRRVRWLQSADHTLTLQIVAGRTRQCQLLEAEVRFVARHVFTPLAMELAFDRRESETLGQGRTRRRRETAEFCGHCAVLDPSMSRTSRDVVTYQHGCRGQVCNVDLRVKTVAAPYKFTLGSSRTLAVVYHVRNAGEKAFDAQLTIVPSPPVAFAKIPSHCVLEPSANQLICALCRGEAFTAEALEELDIILDVGNLTGQTHLVVRAEVQSTGNELEPKDNVVENVILLQETAELDVLGKPQSLYVNLNEAAEKLILPMKFKVVNRGPSTVNSLQVSLVLPIGRRDPSTDLGTYVMEGSSFNTSIRYDGHALGSSAVRPLNGTDRLHHLTASPDNLTDYNLPPNRTLMLLCLEPDVICVESHFVVLHFAPKRRISLQVSLALDPNHIQGLMGDSLDYLLLMPEISFQRPSNVNGHLQVSYKVKPLIMVNLTAPETPLWILVGASFAGVLLVALLTLWLLKMGFFRRQTREEMFVKLERKEMYKLAMEDEEVKDRL